MSVAITSPSGSSSDVSQQSRRFVVLDGLRGIAAFAVIADHIPSSLVQSLIQGRYLAVDFFFALSGFVLAHAYQSRFEKGLSAVAFMRLRFIRLYPMYMAGLAIALALALYLKLTGGEWASWKKILAIAGFSVLFLPTPRSFGQDDLLYPFNPPAWTLLFELVANAVYAVFARFLTPHVLVAVLLVFGPLVALLIPGEEDLGAGWKWSDAEIGLVRVLYGFFAGVLIYKLRDRFHFPAVPAWGAALLLLAVLCSPVPDAWRRWFDVLACVLLFPALIVVAQGAVATGIAGRIASRLGIMSYGVYVLHQPIFRVLDSFWTRIGWENPPGVLNIALVAVTAGVLAWAADRLYDVPMRRFLTRVLPFSGRSKAGAGGALRER